MVKTAEVAQGHATEAIDLVLANPEMGRRLGRFRFGFEPCTESRQRCVPGKGAIGTLLVLIDAERIQLKLQD